MEDYIDIGPAPPEEMPLQVGSSSSAAQRAECYRYIISIRKFLGDEPEGARLAVKGFSHDFGTYYEVVCYYDPKNQAAVNYAYACESRGPTHWVETVILTAGTNRKTVMYKNVDRFDTLVLVDGEWWVRTPEEEEQESCNSTSK